MNPLTFLNRTLAAAAVALTMTAADLSAQTTFSSTMSVDEGADADAGAITMSLDSCRAMAVANNKKLRISSEQVRAAGYQRKEAFAAYLPSLDFAGGYMYNQKKISIFDSDQLLPVKSFDLQSQSYQFNLVKNPITGEVIKGPDGTPIPSDVALIPKEAMEFDTHNVFFGAVTLTQPIFMGGKILAMNKLTEYAEEAQKALRDNTAQDVVYAVDAAYWQVVSLRAKQKLAVSYVALLDTLRHDVGCMLEQGVATKADLLSVEVKLNEANVDLTRVNNGVVLSRMALAQLCGLPVNTPIEPADSEPGLSADNLAPVATDYNMADVYARRNDLRALGYAVKAGDQQSKVALSSMLPNLALIGAYEFSNPNMFNGFKKRFAGQFSVGAMLTIPIWHWGGNYNKYRAAKSQALVRRLQLEDAREMVDLQVKQSAFRAREALKTRIMTESNIAKADENLRQARLAFREGMMTPEQVMEAQTAWLKAGSENVDAAIDVMLCDTYLSKVLGTLNY
ncbi:MAG: TolC family protein [Muribaculaceae bacterium]|uniref:TolC family protein n=1 Tax=uncultured Duncaniella sp. TaxID=2768039 RepID=UPI00267621F9|nr:TolC family protein [uncultured Duncaniella sp.]MCI9043605.1 TolC family protein [Muribaculaceae bacterium]